ncbi:hypothetical protein SAY86_002498 [Trapa natans]|uniref:Uncharacterized protein n=1 Tax=Trapa natans TaxID=22666 RepID=A0AAN7QZM1_TRANT|nr:hypothetical protein SAY86_002498 [Trapa natans]
MESYFLFSGQKQAEMTPGPLKGDPDSSLVILSKVIISQHQSGKKQQDESERYSGRLKGMGEEEAMQPVQQPAQRETQQWKDSYSYGIAERNKFKGNSIASHHMEPIWRSKAYHLHVLSVVVGPEPSATTATATGESSPSRPP